jgi:hypothetical protein
VVSGLQAARSDGRLPCPQLQAAAQRIRQHVATLQQQLDAQLAAQAALAAARSPPVLLEQMLLLRELLPTVNVSRLLAGHPLLLRHGPAALRQLVQEVGCGGTLRRVTACCGAAPPGHWLACFMRMAAGA